MDYLKTYNSLIEKAREKNPQSIGRYYQRVQDFPYYERHHIIPKCVGGKDEMGNLVYLTFRQHFIAHKLLVLIYPESKGLKCALSYVIYGNRRQYKNLKLTSRDIELLKQVRVERMRGRKQDQEQIDKRVSKLRGQKRSAEYCEWDSNRLKGHTFTQETKDKISNTLSGFKQSEEQCDKKRKYMYGNTRGFQPKTDAPKVKCGYCGTICCESTYKRYHGRRCRVYQDLLNDKIKDEPDVKITIL